MRFKEMSTVTGMVEVHQDLNSGKDWASLYTLHPNNGNQCPGHSLHAGPCS